MTIPVSNRIAVANLFEVLSTDSNSHRLYRVCIETSKLKKPSIEMYLIVTLIWKKAMHVINMELPFQLLSLDMNVSRRREGWNVNLFPRNYVCV